MDPLINGSSLKIEDIKEPRGFGFHQTSIILNWHSRERANNDFSYSFVQRGRGKLVGICFFLTHRIEQDISTAFCFGNYHFVRDQHRIRTFIRLRYQISTKKYEILRVLDIYQSMKTFEILLEDKLE